MSGKLTEVEKVVEPEKKPVEVVATWDHLHKSKDRLEILGKKHKIVGMRHYWVTKDSFEGRKDEGWTPTKNAKGGVVKYKEMILMHRPEEEAQRINDENRLKARMGVEEMKESAKTAEQIITHIETKASG